MSPGVFSPPTLPPISGRPVPPLGDTANVPAPKTFGIADLKQYFHVVVKRIWLVALCFVVSLAVTVSMLVRQVAVYRSRVSMLFTEGLKLPAVMKQQEIEVRGEFIETTLQIIQSNLIISRARERMNRPAEEISSKLVRVWADMGWKTAIMYIQCESTDPVFASEFANAMAAEFLEFKTEERTGASQTSVVSLTQQATRLRDELKKAEERVLAFEKENSVVALLERGNIAAKNLAGLATQAADYRTKRLLLEAQRPMLTSASDEIVLSTLSAPRISQLIDFGQPPIAMASNREPGTGPATEARSPPEAFVDQGFAQMSGWEGLKRQRAMLDLKLADLRERFRDTHPAVEKILAEIRSTEKEIDLELQFALKQFYNELEALNIKEQSARRVLMDWEDEAISLSRKEREYETLRKDVDRLTGLYDLIFSRLKEVDVSIGVEPESIRILEPAVPSYSPVTPRKLQSIFTAALIGLGIGLGLVFGIEFLDDSIRYPEEVAKDLNTRFLGVIPAANWDPDDLRTHLLSNMDQKSGLSEAYRNIRSALLFITKAQNLHTIAVTSAIPKEGKTTTCLNLSVSLAQAGMRVLLIDGDMRRGELHKFFGLEAGRGFSDVLIGQAKPESVIQRTGIPNLDLVATGAFPPNPAELILRNEFTSFIDYARRTYDKILIDCPPVMAVSEASTLASLTDGVIMVVWAGQTSRKLSRQALNIIQQRGANVIGCVMNNLEFGRVGYYYYSTYYGYYDYDYRYDRPRSSRT